MGLTGVSDRVVGTGVTMGRFGNEHKKVIKKFILFRIFFNCRKLTCF